MVRREGIGREETRSGFVESYWRRSSVDVEITHAFVVNESIKMALLRTMVFELLEENERLRDVISKQAEEYPES